MEVGSRRRAIVPVVCAVVLAVPVGTLAAAQEHDEENHSEAGAAEHREAHEEHELHRHHFSIFLGATDGEVEKRASAGAVSGGEEVVVEDSRAFTIGLDYEYRLNNRWGVAQGSPWSCS
jgi:hypothetical protein